MKNITILKNQTINMGPGHNMKKTFIKKIEKKLSLEKQELLFRASKISTQDDVDFDGDETDEIQAKMIVSLQNSLNQRAADTMKKIDVALLKIKNGTYGKCEDCEEDIGEKRLEFNPHSSTCISCAEEREMNLKRKGR